mmetsp:Transcript_7321/g.21281  ORF Transcript_7321/g.21281 Transcript_7321/m.21281 type:complete len:93 (+) Transcript_7321:283-561(+)
MVLFNRRISSTLRFFSIKREGLDEPDDGDGARAGFLVRSALLSMPAFAFIGEWNPLDFSVLLVEVYGDAIEEELSSVAEEVEAEDCLVPSAS